MKKLFGATAFVTVILFTALTSRAETYTAYLSPAQEVPAAASTGSGRAIVKLNAAGTSIDWAIVFNGMTSAQTLSHIHGPAAIGVNAAVVINFGTVGGTSGTLSGTAAITPTQVGQLRSGQFYVNIHSVNFPNGELRGQLAKNRPVDLDGDGRSDFSVLRFPNVAPPGVAQITYLTLASTAGFLATNFGDANTDFPVPGDYDGDGKDDYALYRNGLIAGDPSFFFLIRSGTNTFQATNWGVRGDQGVSRDYDGDGKTDIAVFRRGAVGGNPAFWYMLQSGSNTLRSVQWGTTGDTAGGTSGDVPVPGDYDGDGKYDVAVYRYGGLVPNNTFILQRSSDNAVLFQSWGNFQTDYIVPGDYDGDGKTDFCAVRIGTNNGPLDWYVLKSSGGVSTTRFGISTDRITQGDFDGDGRTDIGVFRPNASTFFVIRSLTNTVLSQPWGAAGDFPVNTFDAR